MPSKRASSRCGRGSTAWATRSGEHVPLRVNGTSLSAPEDALEAVHIARTSNAVQVDILRAGRVITLRYTLLG